MKQTLYLLVALIVMAGCARLPVITPDSHPAVNPAHNVANGIFRSGEWQLSHTIKATVPGGKTVEMVGVSVLSSTDNTIRCVLMTLEGLVLFSGRYDGKITVEKAVSPFDRPGFPEGLIHDLNLLYFEPGDPMVSSGRLSDGARIVRFSSKENITTDLILREDQTWAIYEYSSRSKRIRSIEAREITAVEGGSEDMIAEHIILERQGLFGYRLDMRLVEAIRLND